MVLQDELQQFLNRHHFQMDQAIKLQYRFRLPSLNLNQSTLKLFFRHQQFQP